jgi:hypothetical protein
LDGDGGLGEFFYQAELFTESFVLDLLILATDRQQFKTGRFGKFLGRRGSDQRVRDLLLESRNITQTVNNYIPKGQHLIITTSHQS